ncbi:MAG: biotin/lipoate A/B protein ligase family protein [Nitrospinota bacterium]
MALEEVLLRRAGGGKSPPTVRFFAWRPPALSVGVGQRVERDVDLAALAGAGVDLVRRPSGGRAVLHDRELTYSVACPESLLPGGIEGSYRRLSRGLAEGLRRLGLEAELAPPRREEGRGRVSSCFATTSVFELVVGGRKVVGSAQRRAGGAVLQHGSVLLRYEPEAIGRFLRGQAAGGGGGEGNAAGIEQVLARRVGFAELALALREGLSAALGAELEPGELTREEGEEAERLAEEKYRSPAWNLRGEWSAARSLRAP